MVRDRTIIHGGVVHFTIYGPLGREISNSEETCDGEEKEIKTKLRDWLDASQMQVNKGERS